MHIVGNMSFAWVLKFIRGLNDIAVTERLSLFSQQLATG